MLPLSLLSSSSSSSNGLSFIINDSDDEIIFPVVQHLIESEDDPQNLVFLLQLQQTASSSHLLHPSLEGREDASTEIENRPINAYTDTTLQMI